MGYERSRFQGDVDEELICSICSGVLEEPLRISPCEHAFCAACIHEWLLRHSTCPVDREPITNNQLEQVPRIFRNLLSRLQIACDNAIYGCQAVVALEQLSNHLRECQHSADLVPVFNN
ncbi:E3 ubiquitin-protein ligase NRDP1-like [Crassostrea virginica]